MSERGQIDKYSILALTILVAVNCSGCVSTFPFVSREKIAENIACKGNFRKNYIQTANFTLTTYYRFQAHQKPLRIYIEGDGRAWESKRRLSSDPTPLQPVALKLAAIDKYDNVAYIARPGQYVSLNLYPCDPTYWSQRRFAPEVVNSISQAIDSLKTNAKAPKIELIGYSGGGALAILIASQRDDVLSVKTIAGNLDHKELCKYHKVSPLTGSLNPIDVAQDVSLIPQYHFVSNNDKVVPPFIADNFFESSGSPDTIKIVYVNNVSHAKGWCENWPTLLDRYSNKKSKKTSKKKKRGQVSTSNLTQK